MRGAFGSDSVMVRTRLLFAAGEQLGIFDRFDQASLAGDAFTGDIKRGAVVDRRSYDRQTKGNIHAAQRFPGPGFRIDRKAEQLDRNVALIVIHRNHGVELERGTNLVELEPGLRAMGHKVREMDFPSGLQGIVIGPDGLTGGADPRREGVALGD